jgi:hypothetical protein
LREPDCLRCRASDLCNFRKAVNIGLVTGAVANEQTPTLSPEVIDLPARQRLNGSVTIAVPPGSRPAVPMRALARILAHDASVCI